ncbi:hypothetical protein GPUN_0875 [Glaciecola punicea ACAM 611]|uniref:Uncharacterized protein n=1 Tax=Glaciecola punicea ACAM 611 TaxID=1121923 RepID=H5T9N0_9ALTE|nr:hypothetical protein [Glaciecola punicea]GAB55007.1 hypothetical protein GPUN_0875 [Glaciecola punicea ACAM 611]
MHNFNIQNNILTAIETITLKLQPKEAIAVELLITHLNQELSTFDLSINKIDSPAQCVWRLKQKGALIKSVRRTVNDAFDKEHKGIACYTLQGWKQ